MPLYEVEYSYPETHYALTTVTADNIDLAEQAALDQLSDSLGPEIVELCIETIQEVKN